MIRSFPNNIITNYFNEIRNLLYKADGRNELPPDNPFDFKKTNTNLVENNIDEIPNISNRIQVLPDYSLTDVKNTDLLGFDLVKGIDLYKKNFINLPITFDQTNVSVGIDFYFYLYSEIGKDDPGTSALIHYTIPSNYAMFRSDFLYMMFVRKFESMADNYQHCIRNTRVDFQFNKKTKEKVILLHLMSFYSNILNADDKQLSVFAYVQLSKQIADVYSKILIEFLTVKLNTISPEHNKYYVVAPEDKETVKMIDEKIIYELPENFSLIKNGLKSEALDIKQTAVLFYYLRKHKATIDYGDKSFSKLIHYLTGHSANNLRQKSGFGNIIEILRSSKNGIEKNNLKKVKELLENILHDIDKEIDK